MRFEAIARGPIRVASERVMIEESKPVIDAVFSHSVNGNVRDLGQSFSIYGESFGRLRVVAGVVPARVIGVRPRMRHPSMGQESAGDGVGITRFRQRAALEAFDFHGFLMTTASQ